MLKYFFKNWIFHSFKLQDTNYSNWAFLCALEKMARQCQFWALVLCTHKLAYVCSAKFNVDFSLAFLYPWWQ